MMPYHVCVEYTNGDLMVYLIIGLLFGAWFMYMFLCIMCCINKEKHKRNKRKHNDMQKYKRSKKG